MPLAFANIAFTPSVRAQQDRFGSAKTYDKFLSDDRNGGDRLGPQEAEFLSARDGFYQATVSETGWPYVQFRGGQPGFLKVLDDKTVAYADFRGNRQYISTGNLSESDRISIIAMDYPNRRRLKLLGHASILGPDAAPEMAELLRQPEGRTPVERVVIIRIAALDWNCPQHIPRRMTAEEFDLGLVAMQDQLAKLTEENRTLKAQLALGQTL